MSYSPPPGPPEPSVPPQGGYGPAPSYASGQSYGAAAPGGARFDPKSVDPLDWAAIAAGVLALIFSFFAFYTYTAKGQTKSQGCSRLSEIPPSVRGTISDLCNGDSYSAWNGFFGWFGVLLALLGALLVAVAVLAPRLSLPFPVRLAAAGAYVLGFVFVLLALFVVPRWPAADLFGVSDSDYKKGIDEGHGFSYWIVLALTLIGAALALVRFTQTGGKLPARGGAPQTSTPADVRTAAVRPAAAGNRRRDRRRDRRRPRRDRRRDHRRAISRDRPRAISRAPRPARRRAYQQPPPGYQQPPPPGYNPPPQ